MKRLSSLSISFVILCFVVHAAIAQTSIVTRVLTPPRNFEIALGNTVTPSVMVANVSSNSVSGVKLYYRIQNVATGIVTYLDSVTLPSLAAGDSIQLTFAAYVTNPDSLSQLGTFDGCLMAADTQCALLFGMRRTATPFIDASDNYAKTVPNALTPTSIDIPDQTLWASVGATVVDGENSTWDPPPPRYPGVGVGPDLMVGPVIRLDRLDYSGNFYNGNGVGDTLTSYPINLQGKDMITLSFDYTRSGRQHYPLGWDADVLLGPESTVLNVNTGEVVRAGDSLVLEFRDPSQPGLNVAPNGWNEIAAIDGGRDFEFKSLYAWGDTDTWHISINGVTKIITKTPNYLTADFRFRLRLKAKDNTPGQDDADVWYIDNPRVLIPLVPSVEMNWVRIVNPYSKVPIFQAVFPVFVHAVTGNLEGWSPQPFTVKIANPSGDTIYSQSITPAAFGPSVDTIMQFPNWDATHEPGSDTGAYTAIASVPSNWSEPYIFDQTYTKFYLKTGTANSSQEFAMDDGNNGIPTITGITNSGIGFSNSSGSFAMKFQLVRPDTFYGVRAYFGSANSSNDAFRITVLNGSPGSDVPGDPLSGVTSTLQAHRGPNFDAFSTYLYPNPIPLPPGIYWISISQLNATSMDLGGCIARGGCVTTESDPTGISPDIQPIYGPSSPGLTSYGTQEGTGLGDNNGDISRSFAIEVTAGSGGWAPILPLSGWSPEMSDAGIPFSAILNPLLNVKNQLVDVGVYMPMIRPIIGQKPLSSVAVPATNTLQLEPNIPNPFQPAGGSTSINFETTVESQTTLTISNVLGNIVVTLVDEELPSGTHSAQWNGRDANGASVPAGIYFVSLISGGEHAMRKLIVQE